MIARSRGPNGANKNGALSDLLSTTADNFGGEGAQFHQTIQDFSTLSQTLDDNKEELFGSARELEGFINTLATNDKLVRAFVKDLAGVSSSLVSERVEIQRALAAVADSVGTVKTFVQANRQALVTDVEKLTKLMKTINSERDSIDTALNVAPVAINNLTLAYNQESGTIGSRIGIQGQLWDADGFLCAIVK